MIVYAVVCRSIDAAVLVEFSEIGGNAPQVSMALMEFLKGHPQLLRDGERKTFVQQNEEHQDFFRDIFAVCTGGADNQGILRHFFHVFHKDGVFYTSLSDDPDPLEHKINFAFLDTVWGEFTRMYRARRIKSCNAYAMDKNFSPHLRSTMHYYNSNHEKLRQDDKVQELMAKVEKMKDVMGQNLNLLLRRGETLESMSQKADAMNQDSIVFQKQSRTLRNQLRFQNCKLISLLSLIVVGLIYVFLASICGLAFQRCRVRD